VTQIITYAIVALVCCALVWCIYKGVKSNRGLSKEGRKKAGNKAALAFFVIFVFFSLLGKYYSR
jgi:hypothetical protein